MSEMGDISTIGVTNTYNFAVRKEILGETDKSTKPYLLFKLAALSLATVLWSNLAAAQTSQPAVLHACTPVSERTGELGCWIWSDEPIGALTRTQAFWHLYVYPTRAAAEAEKGQRGTVVEGLGKIWLMTIDEESWKLASGERVAKIGLLPFTPGEKYSAQYMEAFFTPGMTAAPHRHPGLEAWYTMSGQTCLETPEGAQTGRAGGPPVIVPRGLPMHLTATGSEKRRAMVLVLHESSKPYSSPAKDWTPKGLCKN
jgi:quercetin dioxygenase-like cupin family protein